MSTKVCRCGCTNLIKFESLNRKRCSECNKIIFWPLTTGQKPLNGSHRAGHMNKGNQQ